MTTILRAIYEGGVLRLLQPVDLPEQQIVQVTITYEPIATQPWRDDESVAACLPEDNLAVSLDGVRSVLAKIPGSPTDDFIAERDER